MIRHETSVAKTPELNGVAERQNRTIIESAISMLHSTGQPRQLVLELWAEATKLCRLLTESNAGEGTGRKNTLRSLDRKEAESLTHPDVWMCRLLSHPS